MERNEQQMKEIICRRLLWGVEEYFSVYRSDGYQSWICKRSWNTQHVK